MSDQVEDQGWETVAPVAKKSSAKSAQKGSNDARNRQPRGDRKEGNNSNRGSSSTKSKDSPVESTSAVNTDGGDAAKPVARWRLQAAALRGDAPADGNALASTDAAQSGSAPASQASAPAKGARSMYTVQNPTFQQIWRSRVHLMLIVFIICEGWAKLSASKFPTTHRLVYTPTRQN